MKLQIEYHRIEIISGILRPTRSASQPEATAPTRRSHSVIVNTDGDRSQRHVEFLRDRHHDQQEDGEIECVQGPAQPGGPPGDPLILGRLLPPWNRIARLRMLLAPIDLPPRNVTNAVNGGATAGREDNTAGSRTQGETVKPTLVHISVMRQLKRCLLSNGASRPPKSLQLRSRRPHNTRGLAAPSADAKSQRSRLRPCRSTW